MASESRKDKRRVQIEDDSDSDDDGSSIPPKKSKVKYDQVFLPKYKDVLGIKESKKGKHFAFCTYCKSDFSISHGGANDIDKHVKRPSHLGMVKAAGNTNRITSFFVQPGSSELDLKVIRAEVMMTEMVVQLNLPLAACDILTKTVRAAFPDSQIAQKYACGRSKATVIAKKLAEDVKEDVKKDMEKKPFALATDGSTDQKEKQYPVVISSPSLEHGVTTRLLSVPILTGVPATGENIYKLMKKEVPDLGKCICFGSDNCAVNTGVRKGVFAFMLRDQPNMYFSGCPIHLVHHAAERAASCLPFSLDDIMIRTYHYLDKSSNRLDCLEVYQKYYDVEHHNILRHVSTRWLSIGRCLDRLMENFDALRRLFKDADAKKKVKSEESIVQKLYDFYRSPTNYLYCLFVQDIISVFEDFNRKLQTESPQIHNLRRLLHKLLRDLIIRFKLPGAIYGKHITKVSLDDNVGQRADEDLIIGNAAKDYIKQKERVHLKDDRIKEFYSCVRKFFLTACRYIKEKLPLDNELLLHAEVADVDLRTHGVKSTDLTFFLDRFPSLLPEGVSKHTVELEFADFQSLEDVRKADRMDRTWVNVAQIKDTEDIYRFRNLAQVMLGILCIPHANASCERIFSCVRKNKTDQRASLGANTLDALLVIKTVPGEAYTRKYSVEKLKSLKSAYHKELTKK